MKKSLFFVIIFIIITSTILSKYITPDTKSDNEKTYNNNIAQEKVNSEDDFLNDFEIFKHEVVENIISNKKTIADLESEKGHLNIGSENEWETKLWELKKRNNYLQKQLEEFKAIGYDEWITFKQRVTLEITDLNSVIKEFTNDNK